MVKSVVNGTLTWLLGDHLGSTSVTADASGAFQSELRYTAFGETRSNSGPTPTDYRYTGQRHEAEFGLYFYKARWYDPASAHFTQADTLIPEPGNPLALDRYAYVMNNPLRYTDPSGHISCDSPYALPGECDPNLSAPKSSYPYRLIQTELNISEMELVKKYQQLQDGPYCASHAMSTGLNILYGTNTTGIDILNTFTFALGNKNPDLRGPKSGAGFTYFSWLPNGGAVLPYQQKRIIDSFGKKILGQSEYLPSAEVTDLSPSEMINIIEDPNTVALFTYNTEKGKWLKSGHTVMLAAYDPEQNQFGFLNSGFGRDSQYLTWFTIEEVLAFMQDPIGLWQPNFVVISLPSGYRNRGNYDLDDVR
jgi:RHS repeat-associated protein